MNKLSRLLNTPMADSCDLRRSVRILTVVALFVTAFLWIFEPFGFSMYRGNKLWLSVQFGIITFTVGMLVEIIEVKVFRFKKEHPSWRFKNWLLSSIMMLLAISAGNFLFMNYLSEGQAWSAGSFLSFVANTTAIGIFPITISGLITLRNNENANTQLATTFDLQSHMRNEGTVVLANNAGDDLQIPLPSILFLEASQNYVAVHFIDQGQDRKTLIRNTLKKLMEELPGETLQQCHRSFVVNTDHITQVNGNSQGLILTLINTPAIQVPVSRKYIESLRQTLA